MSNKTLLIGADGQLGYDLKRVLNPWTSLCFNHSQLDVTDRKEVFRQIEVWNPDVVINTSAFNRVDDAESCCQEAFDVNVLGVKYLAEACKKFNATLVHFSTDYVFGEKNSPHFRTIPYTEYDETNPQSFYGITKLMGEQVIKYTLDNYFILRTCGLYGLVGCKQKGRTNFVENMIAAAKKPEPVHVTNTLASPTYTLDLAKKTLEIIANEKFGTYHVTNSGLVSWYSFTKEIFRLLNIKTPVKPVKYSSEKHVAIRPDCSYLSSVLNIGTMRNWKLALKDYLKEKGHL